RTTSKITTCPQQVGQCENRSGRLAVPIHCVARSTHCCRPRARKGAFSRSWPLGPLRRQHHPVADGRGSSRHGGDAGAKWERRNERQARNRQHHIRSPGSSTMFTPRGCHRLSENDRVIECARTAPGRKDAHAVPNRATGCSFSAREGYGRRETCNLSSL